MKTYTIEPITAPLDTYITLPGSKSITNRALLLAALAKGKSILNGMLISDDTRACIKALNNLGVCLEVDEKKAQCYVEGTSGNFPIKEAKIWCQDAGTVARFLLAACAGTQTGNYHFSGTPQLQARPLNSLLQVLKEQGAEITPLEATHLPVSLLKKGNLLRGGEMLVPANESSQFFSAMLMIAPYAATSVVLRTDTLVSAPYIQLTIQMMQEFGISVTEKEQTFKVFAPDCYQGQLNYEIEPDLSTASYFFAAAAVTNGKITIPHINKITCKQGDIAFLDVLEKMGCKIEYKNHSITVYGTENLQGQEFNMNAISDTMMTLACIAPFANSPTTITGIAHVRHKESDRIEAVIQNFARLGINTQSGKDYITVFPSHPHAGDIDCYHDHRIAMAFSLIGLRTPGIVIKDKECVSKTCPNFFDLWKKLTLLNNSIKESI